jgi:hypothetical protein
MDIVEKLLNRYKLTFSDDSFEKFSSILKQEDYQKDEIILEQGKISRYYNYPRILDNKNH